MRRTAYLIAFAVLAAVAALLTLRAQRTVAVVVATHDLRAGSQVQAADVDTVAMHDDGVPSGALSRVDLAVGEYTSWPLTAGEPVLSRQLRAQRSGGGVIGGLDVPSGYRAVAVPVLPAGAVGGMLAAGDHVDVYATPLPGHSADGGTVSPAGPTAQTQAASLPARAQPIGHDVLVLQMRSDQGQALDTSGGDSVHGLNFGSGKLGSVILAVPDRDVPAYAAATSDETIYLALSVG